MNQFGHFSGNPRAEWLSNPDGEDRDMRLLADFWYDDPAGLRTLDTMRNLSLAGMHSVIVVSNPFHVARSVFLARASGLDACGVEAPYGREYSFATMLKNRGREAAARVWAWLDVYVFGAAS